MEETAKVFENIFFDVNLESFCKSIKVEQDSDDYHAFSQLLEEAKRKANPRALYRESYVEKGDNNAFSVDGIRLNSRVLKINLEGKYRIFPFLATCGIELEEWSEKHSDILLKYFSDYIKNTALTAAVDFLKDYIKKTYSIPEISSMSPGSLNDWPIEQQEPLFQILGNSAELSGVVLTESFLMKPSKSISGIIFPVEESFESCMLCPRENCPERRADYDRELYKRRFSI
jgi:hypothetical protein